MEVPFCGNYRITATNICIWIARLAWVKYSMFMAVSFSAGNTQSNSFGVRQCIFANAAIAFANRLEILRPAVHDT